MECCDEARTVRPRQKNHPECISAESSQLNGGAGEKYSRAARAQNDLFPSFSLSVQHSRAD
jgi:hypothetical protein